MTAMNISKAVMSISRERRRRTGVVMCKRSGLPSRDQVINDSYYEEKSALSGERDLKRAKCCLCGGDVYRIKDDVCVYGLRC